MTDTTISNLPAGAPAEPTDQIPIARGGANYSLTAQDIANLGGGGGSPGGVNTNVQFNNNGAFGGTNDFITDGAGAITLTTAVTVGDSVNAGASYVSVTANPLNGHALIDCIEPAGGIGINVASPTSNNQVTGMLIFSGNINGSIALKFFDEPILWQNVSSGHNVLSFNVLSSDSVQTLNNTLDDGLGNMTATSVVVNSATGGSQGVGTINDTAIYTNGVQIAAGILTVATLPTLAAGSRAFVSDANAPAVGTFGIAVVAGGAFTVPVWCDGAVWYVG